MYITRLSKKKLLVIGILVFILIGLMASMAFGDVGNNVSRSPSSSSSSSSSDDDFRNYSNTSSTTLAEDISAIFSFFARHYIITLLLVGGFIYLLYKAPATDTDTGIDADTLPENNNLEQLKQSDPNFSEPTFVSKVNNMFIQLQEAWTKKQWNMSRPFETDALFNMHNKQMQSYIENHTSNVVDNIAILDTDIVSYKDDGVNDIIEVRLKTRFNDYVVDDNNGEVIQGDKNQEIFMTYLWTLIRKKGVLTKTEKEGATVTQCPNCGANLSINASGKCDYCGSIVSNGEHDWVLSSIEVISQE